MKFIICILYCATLWWSILNAQSIVVKPSTTAFVFPNGVSVPPDYPHVTIPIKNNPDTGFIFINNWGGTPYIAILDNNGSPVFYRKMPAYARDFKLQKNGMLSYRLADPFYRFYEMDSGYTVTREISAKNGYGTDEHELQILPNGNVLLIALEYKTVNMSALVPGGKTNATVIGNHIQEIDRNGQIIFEWKCWDHFDITDAVHENLTAQTIDYVHMNAIAVDHDSNLIISSRHLSEITKIDRKSGKILWRLGGKHNQFAFINDPFNGPSYQHDVRVLPNGHYTVFDNGNYHTPSISRAVEYQVDTVAKTATMVWQYRHTPDRYTWWMGNVQRLANGNTLINWADGSLPKLTEVTPSGVTVMELNFVTYAHSYRVFRFPWKGKASVPFLKADAATDKVTLLMNTFDGAPEHMYYIYADTIPHPALLIDSSTSSAVDLTGMKGGKRYYFRVTSKDSSGIESPPSNEEEVLIKFFAPGENLVVNGDFSHGSDQWNYNITPPAIAVPYITSSGEFFVQIGNGGTQAWHVQLAQEGIPLENGKKYRFAFDAYATENRTIDPKIVMAVAPNTNYSKTSSIFLTTGTKRFSFDFTMQDATDNAARVVFNCGLSDIDVLIDNVSIVQIGSQSVSENIPDIPSEFLLEQNYPNPFNPVTTVAYRLPEQCRVTVRIYDLLGRLIEEIVNGVQSAGRHMTVWNATEPSGMYLCSIEVRSTNDPTRMFHRIMKMAIIK